MRAVLRYYEGAVLAWDAIEGNREREHLSRKLPVPDSLAVAYFTDSQVASLIDEFTFLDATVARRPSGGRLVEASGLWRPVWARLLLWERGGQAHRVRGAACSVGRRYIRTREHARSQLESLERARLEGAAAFDAGGDAGDVLLVTRRAVLQLTRHRLTRPRRRSLARVP
jgi:hypothetical protein